LIAIDIFLFVLQSSLQQLFQLQTKLPLMILMSSLAVKCCMWQAIEQKIIKC